MQETNKSLKKEGNFTSAEQDNGLDIGIEYDERVDFAKDQNEVLILKQLWRPFKKR